MIIFSLSSSFVKAQNLQLTIKFADNQYNNANYKLALKEYQRAIFFSTDSINYLYKQTANSFFQLKKYDKAAYYYELSYKTTKNDSLKNEILLKKTACFIILKKNKFALLELVNLPDSLTSYFEYRKKLYYSVIYFGLNDFDNSEKYFFALIDKNELSKIKKVKKIFRKKRYLYRPNPKTAKILSIIIPGAGQLLSGDTKSSLNSLILTGSLAILGAYIIQYYSVFDAIVSITPWFLRYYKGGYKNAKKIALEKRNKKRNNSYKNLLKIVNRVE